MQTWQVPDSRVIDYIFKSAFEGKVEVGWNYARISFIRGMWAGHSKALARTWGRELPEVSAIKVVVPQMAVALVDKAIQIHGGAGVSSDFPLARLYAMLRTLRLADGPDEVHIQSVARTELARYQ